MDKSVFINHIRDFIFERNPGLEKEVLPSDNLIRTGIVDSFMIMEIIMKIESITNAPVNIDGLTVKNISSMDEMFNFFIEKRSN